MIQFDKDIDKRNSGQHRNDKVVHDKKVRQTTERNAKVDYDFADRDISQSMNVGNEMLGAVVKEEDKVEKPDPQKVKIDKKKRQLNKQAEFDRFYDDYNDIELTK